eukprot:4569020-Pyramimonas_sp.AAC.1
MSLCCPQQSSKVATDSHFAAPAGMAEGKLAGMSQVERRKEEMAGMVEERRTEAGGGERPLCPIRNEHPAQEGLDTALQQNHPASTEGP